MIECMIISFLMLLVAGLGLRGYLLRQRYEDITHVSKIHEGLFEIIGTHTDRISTMEREVIKLKRENLKLKKKMAVTVRYASLLAEEAMVRREKILQQALASHIGIELSDLDDDKIKALSGRLSSVVFPSGVVAYNLDGVTFCTLERYQKKITDNLEG